VLNLKKPPTRWYLTVGSIPIPVGIPMFIFTVWSFLKLQVIKSHQNILPSGNLT
jgi:hypothetical protein